MPQPWEQFQSAAPSSQPWEQFSAPAKPSVMSNIIGQPARLLANAVSTGGQALDIAKNAISGIGQSESTPLDTSNPIATVGDIGGRVAGAAGNMFRTATSPVEAVLRNNIFQPGGMVSNAFLPMIVNKQFEGAGIPQAQLDQVAKNPELQKTFQNTAANSITQSALLAATPRETNLVDMAKENPEGWQRGPYPGEAAAKQALTPDMLNAAAPNAYKAVDASNTGFTGNFATKAQQILENSKLSPIAGKVIPTEDAAINDALSEFDDLKNTPLTLKDYQRIDSNLGDKAAKAYISNDPNKARIIGDAQDKIRTLVSPENLSPHDITGSAEGVNTLTQDAIPMWSVKRKIEDLQQIVDNANRTQNPQTAIMTGFRNFIKSGRAQNYPPEAQALINQLATKGTGADLLSVVGSRLNPIVAGAAGGPAAAVVAQGTSLAARTLGNRIINSRADALVNTMLETVRPSIEKFANWTPPAAPVNIGAMTPAQARTVPMPKP